MQGARFILTAEIFTVHFSSNARGCIILFSGASFWKAQTRNLPKEVCLSTRFLVCKVKAISSNELPADRVCDGTGQESVCVCVCVWFPPAPSSAVRTRGQGAGFAGPAVSLQRLRFLVWHGAGTAARLTAPPPSFLPSPHDLSRDDTRKLLQPHLFPFLPPVPGAPCPPPGMTPPQKHSGAGSLPPCSLAHLPQPDGFNMQVQHGARAVSPLQGTEVVDPGGTVSSPWRVGAWRGPGPWEGQPLLCWYLTRLRTPSLPLGMMEGRESLH